MIVVYKIDRLSRSLMDFAKLVEVFDRHDVTFVSVTQSFNTTTSMGRLTLNILLSFAQFEREVIGERIRDKFAASGARECGWVAGSMLGYDVRDRKLVVNAARRRRSAGSSKGSSTASLATKLTQVLRSDGVTTKTGRPIDKGYIYKLLNNRTYVGEVDAQGQRLSRRAPGDRAAGAVGPRAPSSAGESAGSRQQEPSAITGTAPRPDLRRRRPGDVADAHAPAGKALSLLRFTIGSEGRWR